MESIKLAALRDLAIEYVPRALRARGQEHPSEDSYHVALYGAATLALASAKISAVEHTAASLLQLTMSLSINWDKANLPTAVQRLQLEHQAISAAHDLCTLANLSLPWLAKDAMRHEPAPAPAPAPPKVEKQTSHLPAPPPDIILSTKDAAKYLLVKEQTLHKWASTDTGPIRPTRPKTRRLGWPSNEVLRIMQTE